MGADRGPDEIVAGAKQAQSSTVQPLVVGPSDLDTQGLELIEASEVIGMDEKPTDAVRAKRDSSLVVACTAVGDGRADAMVTPGNTGAMLAASLKYIRRLDGVLRPAIAVVLPARDGPNVLVERRQESGEVADSEPMMSVETIAEAALAMLTLPPEVNMLEAIVLPVGQLYLGRG